MGGSRARYGKYVHDRRVILSSKRTPKRNFSTLTVAAGSAVAVAAVASGAAAGATTVAHATGQAATTAAARHSGALVSVQPIAVVHNDQARSSDTHGRFDKRPAAYTVKPGDSLSAITGRFFGHPDLWPRFYAANVKVVGAYPDRITPGERLSVRLATRGKTGKAIPAPSPAAIQPIPVQQAAAATQPVTTVPVTAPAEAPQAPAASQGTAPGGSFGACVRSRESGGNYQATNAGGYYGAYQFSASTWAAYGGNPADFGNASAAEQDQVFANAIAQGGESNWGPYDGC
ncbi:MAG TPA: transglycosylase family protein [Streptosporangiaceae bacterium]|nr:transglycosylase family protein [Streptosporangiaceae bacterium]